MVSLGINKDLPWFYCWGCSDTSKYFLTERSMAQWTPVSMGWTMKGMQPRPIAVVTHLRVVRGTKGSVFASTSKEAAHTLLMVKPGTITEANACHTNVSTAAWVTARWVEPGCCGDQKATEGESFYEPTCLRISLWPLILTFTSGVHSSQPAFCVWLPKGGGGSAVFLGHSIKISLIAMIYSDN